MNLSQVSKFIFYWKFLDSDKDLCKVLFVVWINFIHQFSSDLVHDWKHQCRLFCKPDSQSWVLGTKMGKNYFKSLLVVHTHLVESVFIVVVSSVVSELSQEIVELVLDEYNHIFLLQPN